ncbi:MAG: DUF3137 domain-containing protein [Deltaproteobacteria bacterium]|jgi:hypothetical protein|nr:DUF3137 domain-containing protein [Deltaproteobacteria bacterium]
MALVFWFLMVPLALIALLWILVKIVVPSLFFKAANKAQTALDRRFEEEFLSGPVSDQKVQRKMSVVFWRNWALLVFGLLLTITPIAKIISAGKMYLTDFFPYLLVGALGVGLIVLGLASLRRSKQLAALIAVPIIREIFGADCLYDSFGHIPDDRIAASGLADDYEDVSGSDFVRGSYRGVPVMFSDVRLTRTERRHDSNTNESHDHVIEVFRGRWLVADFDRELVAAPLTVLERRSGGDSIQMESEAFNRQFSVYCADAHTAFYVLTPHFMERLTAVDAAADGDSRFNFCQNSLQIAVGSKLDLFEAGFFKAPDVAAMRERFRREIGRLTGVLDEMLAHERLFGSDAERRAP